MCVVCFMIVNKTIAGTKNQTGLWTGLNISGDIEGPFKYSTYIEARFYDHENRFQNLNTHAALGYQALPWISFWLGYRYFSRNQIEDIAPTKMWYQDVIINLYKTKVTDLSLRSRIEERERLGEETYNTRLRERLTLSLPKFFCNKFTPVLYDELFYNINSPDWVSNQKRVNQNRAFVGIDIPISKKSFVEVGYLNQFLFRFDQNVNENILYLGLYFTT